jgi:septum formation protein
MATRDGRPSAPRVARIVLASASPRRRALLEAAGFSFDTRPADVDETLESGTPAEIGALMLAARKARATAKALAASDVWVLAADTVVALDHPSGDRLLGKPADSSEARAMLTALSGTRHRVVTGVCALRTLDGVEATGFERTFVTMRTLGAEEIAAYVNSGEWRDKAGGYAIQENADRFVTALEEGGFDNVVGLPVALARELLLALGAPCGAERAGLVSLPPDSKKPGGTP